jgi:hypothetical protein
MGQMSNFGLSGVLVLVLFLPVVGLAEHNASHEEFKKIANDQLDIIYKTKGSPDDAYNQVRKLWEVRASVKKYCNELDLYIYGIDQGVTIVSKQQEIDVKYKSRECNLTLNAETDLIADMMLASAKYYTQNNNKAAAKKIYRDVIITFTGDNYKSQVKKAEFALEDLKSTPDTEIVTSKKKSKKKTKTE